MNYYEPRQIKPDNGTPDAGKWRYTCRNDNRVWEVGYCADDCPGHDTAEEASAHQRAYDLDHPKLMHVEPWSPCAVCGKRTPNNIETNHCGDYYLCDEHNTREHLDELMPQLAYNSISSW